MTPSPVDKGPAGTGTSPHSREHYALLGLKITLRLLLIYLSPVILMAFYFSYQHNQIVAESQQLHLKTIADGQANTLNLFLLERRVNLSSLIEDPTYNFPQSSGMERALNELRKISDAFIDIGFFDSTGVQIAYAGPFQSLERRSYRNEEWYTSLMKGDITFVITDIYLGFRQKPHFTIAVARWIGGQPAVLRATLDPEKIYDYMSSMRDAPDVITTIINRHGYYQLVPESVGTPLTKSPFVPPLTPSHGVSYGIMDGSKVAYAYTWLQEAGWAITVQHNTFAVQPSIFGLRLKTLDFAVGMIIVVFCIILVRARKQVEMRKDSDATRAQLVHAAKLASVGELAAGIAHEINNPLAAISEEAGLMKDLMDPEFGEPLEPQTLVHHLDSIQESVFRCRDITRKLLGFVRKDIVDLKKYDIHHLIDEVVEGFLGQEMTVSNIEVVREYSEEIPEMLTDGNQLEQVFLNILNNAIDAMESKPGRITILTERVSSKVLIHISDTGKGMSPEQMENIFVPFFTTKEVGKGTGLGLSVSYGIIKSLGGNIRMESRQGKGSRFTIELPIR